MNFKRIKCIMTGGCRFKSGMTECHIDENNMVTITETCMNCGKQFSFTIPEWKLYACAEAIHADYSDV